VLAVLSPVNPGWSNERSTMFTVLVVVTLLSLAIGFIGSIMIAMENAQTKREATELRRRQLAELRKSQS
jgi:hypothetical protein